MSVAPVKREGAGPPATPPLKAFLTVMWRVPLERLRWNPVWIAVLGLIVGILYGFGRSLGVPSLFWEGDWAARLLAGMGVGVLLCEMCFVSFLLDSDEPWFEAIFPKSDRMRLAKYFHSLLWPIILGGVVPPAFEAIAVRWITLAGTLAGVAVSLIIGIVLRKISEASESTAVLIAMERLLFQVVGAGATAGISPRSTHWLQKKERRAERWIYAMAAGYFFTLLVAYVVLLTSRHVVSPALAICLLLGLLIRVYGLLVFHFEGLYYLVVAAVVIWCLAMNYTAKDKHRAAGLDYGSRVPLDSAMQLSGDSPRDLEEGRAAPERVFPRLNDAELRVKWRGRFAQPMKPKLVVVASSGGGIRAAVWAVTVLKSLEERLTQPTGERDFPYHVRLVTGASGGALGNAYYVATLAPPPGSGHHVAECGTAIELDDLVDFIARDSLTPVARSVVFHDLWKTFWPPLEGDRGEAMELAWEANTQDVHGHSPLGQPVATLAAGEQDGWRPSIVLSPMAVEDGRRLLISNLDLGDLAQSAGRLLAKDGNAVPATASDRVYSTAAYEFSHLFPHATGLKISTAARLSASFPFVSPSASLPVTPPRRVVDAGYYDNYGVNLAAAWLEKHRDWILEPDNLSGVVLIQIRDGVMYDGAGDPDADRSWLAKYLARGASGLITPIEGASSAYVSMNWFRNNEQVQALSRALNERADAQFFQTVAFEYSDTQSSPAPLSWHLTEAEIKSVKQNMGQSPNVERLDELAKWWQQDHSRIK